MTPNSVAPQGIDAHTVKRAKLSDSKSVAGLQLRAHVFFADEIRTRWERIVAR